MNHIICKDCEREALCQYPCDEYSEDQKERVILNPKSAMDCPECGNKMIPDSGCSYCPVCGYSPCK